MKRLIYAAICLSIFAACSAAQTGGGGGSSNAAAILGQLVTAPAAASGLCLTSSGSGPFTLVYAPCGGAGGALVYSASSLTTGSTTFAPIGGGGAASATEANVQTLMPSTVGFSNLTVKLGTAPGGTASYAFVLRDNSTSEAVTCTITGAATSCTDTTHTFNAAANDLLDIEITPSGTPASSSVQIYLQLGVGGTGTGTVTSFSSGGLAPLFSTSVSTPTSTPSLSFSLTSQNANVIFGGPSSGAAAAPSFRALVPADVPSVFPTFTGTITPNDCAKWSSSGVLTDAGAVCGSGSGVSWGVNTVTFSATPVFNAALGNVQKITLTGNVTSSTLTNAVAGQLITFDVCQDATGGRSFVWPTNVTGTFTIPQGANQCVRQSFAYDGTNAVAQDASQGDGFLLAASSALEPNARTLTCGTGISCVDGGAGGSFNVSGASLVDLTSAQTVTGNKTFTGPLIHQFANAASPGTTQYESVMFGGNGTVTAGTSAAGVLGVCIIGCGTSGNASVAVEGVVNAMFDTASITAGDYVTATTSGTFHDTGSAAYPSSGQVQGKIITSGTSCNVSPGCPFLKFPEEIEAASGGGSSAWSSLANASANLTLSNSTYSTTFDQTSSANWLWANTTAATSSAEADSPIFKLQGNNWSGATPASAADSWTIQDVTGAGANPVSTLTFSHSGSSTASPNAQLSLLGMNINASSINTTGSNPLFLNTPTGRSIYLSPANVATVYVASGQLGFEQAGDHFNNAAANSDLAGTIVITSATSAAQTFKTAYTAAPVCVLTPTSNPGALTWWVTTTTTSVTANLSASGTVTFNYVCMGNPD